MPSPSDILKQLMVPASFFSRFEARLKLLNAEFGVHLTSGMEIDFVQKDWSDMCRKESAFLEHDLCQLFAQDILGQLCNGLTRFDSVIVAGNHLATAGSQDEKLIQEFISNHACGFVAVDFCSDIYRELMPFMPDMYRTTRHEMISACKTIHKDPDQGRNFVKLLKYPDKFKLLN